MEMQCKSGEKAKNAERAAPLEKLDTWRFSKEILLRVTQQDGC